MNHRPSTPPSLLALAALSLLTLALSGCSMGSLALSGPAPVTPTPSTITLSGLVHGGQQPISGASLQLYVAGEPAAPTSGSPTGGFGQGANPLIPPGDMTVDSTNNYWPFGAGTGATCPYTNTTTPVATNVNGCTALPQTNAAGFFTLSSDYTACSTGQLYIVASGGNAGAGTNPAIALMDGLGACSGVTSSTNIYINEITTVGAVWALQNFMAPPSGAPASSFLSQGGSTAGNGVNIGASSGPVSGYNGIQTQQVGLNNAFRMIPNLVNNSTGADAPVNSWATNYPAKIALLADILAYCVNGSATSCSTLMSDATANSITPADTIQAAWQMARNPMLNTVNLSNLASSTPPFTTTLTGTNNADFTLVVAFAPPLPSPYTANTAVYANAQIAIDALGHVWLYNTGGQTGLTAPFMSELDANGATLAGPLQSYTVINNAGLGCAADVTANGATGTTTHALATTPYQFSIDQNGILWGGNFGEASTNCGTYTTERTIFTIDTGSIDAATPAFGTAYWESGGIGGLVIDAANNVWWNPNQSQFQSISSTGAYSINSTAKPGGDPYTAAADTAGNIWAVSSDGVTSPSGFTSATGLLYQIPSNSINGSTASTRNSPTYSIYTAGGTLALTGDGTSETTTTPIYGIQDLATDANNGLWATNSTYGSSSITYFAPQSPAWATAISTAAAIPTTAALTVAVTGMVAPWGVGVDGANHAWIGSSSSSTAGINFGTADILDEYAVSLTSGNINTINLLNSNTNTSTTSYGFAFPSGTTPFPHQIHAVSIDPSGNIWLPSSYATAVGYISVMVGAATPVVTPLALQAQYNLIGKTPQ